MISLDKHREHVQSMVREHQHETKEIREQLGAIKDRVRHLVMVRLAMPNSPQEQEAWDALWELIE